MAVRPIDANAMLNELRPVGFEAEHSAVLLSDVSKMMREWVERQPTLTPPNEWVSVEERLPAPTENPVLVYDCTGVNMAWYSYAMGWTYRTWLPGVEITHWMPLPAPPDRRPPEGEEDNG